MMDKKVFYLLGFIMFLTMTGYGIVLPTLPFIADEIGLTSFQMGSLITGWAAAQLIAGPLWGRLADRIGRKPVLICGLLGFGIAFIILIFAQSYLQLLLARIIGAALSSGTHPAVFSIVSDSSNEKHRNVAIAQIGALNGLGFLCGPALGGIFTPFGIIVPFIVAGSLALMTVPLAIKFIKEPEKVEKRDLEGSKKSMWHSLTMVTKPGYWNLYLITFGISFAASSFFGLLGYFMIAQFEASAIFVSLAFSAQAGVSAIVQFFLLGKIYHIWDEEKITKIGLTFIIAGYCLIAFAPVVWVVIIGSMVAGFGKAFVQPTVIAMLSKQKGMEQGVTMGLHQSMDSFGRIVGPLWGGFIFAVLIPGPFITSAVIVLMLLIIVLVTSQSRTSSLPKVKEGSSRL